MQQYYHAPIDILFEFSEKELSTRTHLNERQITLCYGKDWYRFPSSYLIPPDVDVQFIESEFDGILPSHWPQNSEGLLNNIRRIPSNMNDQNKQERDRFVGNDS